MRIADELRDRREEILRVAPKHGAGNVFVFGSVARGEETADSDVDLLVDVYGETTPWFPGGLVADLEELLGRRVQIVIRRSFKPVDWRISAVGRLAIVRRRGPRLLRS